MNGGSGGGGWENKQAYWESASNEHRKHTKVSANYIQSEPRHRRGLLAPRTDPEIAIYLLLYEESERRPRVSLQRGGRAPIASPPKVKRNFAPRITDAVATLPG